jgi:alpha-D-xyloside xylohydrolase
VAQGGRWHQATHDFLGMPLFVRPGRILALGAVEDRPDYAYADGVTFRVYGLADGAELTATVPDLKGKTVATVTVRRKGRAVEAKLDGVAKNWRLQLAGTPAVDEVEGGAASKDPLGVIVASGHGAHTLRVRLPA